MRCRTAVSRRWPAGRPTPASCRTSRSGWVVTLRRPTAMPLSCWQTRAGCAGCGRSSTTPAWPYPRSTSPATLCIRIPRSHVAMSGCPGAAASDRSAPHFSGGGWLPDLEQIAEWQWRERVAPYWSETAAFARSEHPELMVCFELHPGTYVFNYETFERVRKLGPNLGVNLDPSHFFWQSMDPLAMIQSLGDRIGHVHGKDTTLHEHRIALNGVLDNRWPNPPDEMPWNFATVGRGHDEGWWRRFVTLLRDQGFSGTISIEYEDPFVPA